MSKTYPSAQLSQREQDEAIRNITKFFLMFFGIKLAILLAIRAAAKAARDN